MVLFGGMPVETAFEVVVGLGVLLLFVGGGLSLLRTVFSWLTGAKSQQDSEEIKTGETTEVTNKFNEAEHT